MTQRTMEQHLYRCRYWITLVVLIGYVSVTEAQRGCPQEGCDSRGLNCQADFQISRGSSAEIVWRTNVGGDLTMSVLKAVGCVGNDVNVMCRGGNNHSSGYVSINSTTGAVRWYDTLVTKPRLPIMNQAGAYIAVDPNYMELRLNNGSLVGKPKPFNYYPITNVSSVHYVSEPNTYFFVGMEDGGLYLYDTSGICDASMFLEVKDPDTNHTLSVWVPISRVVVDSQMEPPTAYFIAQNNVTQKYRMVALTFNPEPPYLREKWYLELNTTLDIDSVSGIQLMALDGKVYCSGGLLKDDINTLVISDNGDNGVIQHKIEVFSQMFASLDMPESNSEDADSTLIWMNTMTENAVSSIKSWQPSNSSDGGEFKHSFNLYDYSKLQITTITSQIMVFGVHPDDQTVVFAFMGLNWAGDPDNDRHFDNGCYIVAIKPNPSDNGVEVLWDIDLGTAGIAIGQIIGVNNNMLIAQTSDTDEIVEIVGIKITPPPTPPQ